MKLTYIYHSCYVLEADGFAIVFDYFKDSGPSPLKGYIHDELLRRAGRLYVLSSHFHPDHFNRDVLKWKHHRKDIVYIFSSDILEMGKAKKNDANYLSKGDVFEDANLYVKAFGSTDAGVSFLIRAGGKQIFHAGDLNNWHWADESPREEAEEAGQAFLEELDIIAAETQHFDLAMFPIDPRLGRLYMLGAEQFTGIFKVNTFAPMHFGEAYDRAAAFRDYAEKHHCQLLDLTQKGQQFNLPLPPK